MTDTALTPAAEAAIRERLVLGYRFDTSRYPPFAALWKSPTPFDDIATLLSEIDRIRTDLAEIRETAKLWHGELLGCRTALAAACTERDAALAQRDHARHWANSVADDGEHPYMLDEVAREQAYNYTVQQSTTDPDEIEWIDSHIAASDGWKVGDPVLGGAE